MAGIHIIVPLKNSLSVHLCSSGPLAVSRSRFVHFGGPTSQGLSILVVLILVGVGGPLAVSRSRRGPGVQVIGPAPLALGFSCIEG